MKLPHNIRQRFQSYGKRGGLTRARRTSADGRRAIARRAALRRWTNERFGNPSFASLGYPGGEIIDSGLEDLVLGRETIASLLVSLAGPRLHREGVPLPNTLFKDADDRLYRLLELHHGGLAHARYLAYLKQAESFADACQAARTQGANGAR